MLPCQECDRSLPTIGGLRRHMTRVHGHPGLFVKCQACPQRFRSQAGLDAHMAQQHSAPSLESLLSGPPLDSPQTQQRPSNLSPCSQQPPAQSGSGQSFVCTRCQHTFRSERALDDHFKDKHVVPVSSVRDLRPLSALNMFKLYKTAFNRYLLEFRGTSQDDSPILEQVLSDFRPSILEVSEALYEHFRNFKFELCLHATFSTVTQPTVKQGYIYSKTLEINNPQLISQRVEEALKYVSENCFSRQTEGSRWTFHSFPFLDLNVTRYKPWRGGCRGEKLPPSLLKKKACVSISCDNFCFAWCCAAAKKQFSDSTFTTKHWSRPGHYISIMESLNLTGISPVTELDELDSFEQANTDFAVNVFAWEKHAFPFRISDKRDRPIVVNMLLYEDHYFWIKNFNRFCGSSENRQRKFCVFCMQGFRDVEKLNNHLEACQNMFPTKIEMPLDNESVLKFKNYEHEVMVPFVVIADFECLLPKCPQSNESEENNGSHPLSPTVNIHKHSVCSYALVVVDSAGTIIRFKLERIQNGQEDTDIIVSFLTELAHVHEEIIETLQTNIPLDRTIEVEHAFEVATHCHICKYQFKSDKKVGHTWDGDYLGAFHLKCLPADNDNTGYVRPRKRKFHEQQTFCFKCNEPFSIVNGKVRDHCHLTGAFRGAAHSTCNLRLQNKKRIPVFFHNLRNYDEHLIIRALMSAKDMIKNVSVLPLNLEKFTTVQLDFEALEGAAPAKFVLLDSLMFLNSSLANLVDALKSKGEKLTIFSQYFKSQEQQDLLSRKGYYPYEYMDSVNRFQETALPPRECFFSSLTKQSLTDSEYNHALKVWDSLPEPRTIGQYHDIYLATDVLLLADVVHEFRNNSMSYFCLDPAYYISLPQLSLDAALRVTEVELELLQDYEMYMFFQTSIRGGISMISKRYAVANNRRVPNYDPEKPTSHLMYFDANNLYGWAMCQSLPCGLFSWVPVHELDALIESLADIPKDANYGYVMEVDLDYPDHIHNAHNDYPLAPERTRFDDSHLSMFQSGLLDSFPVLCRTNQCKLIPNLFNKTKYTVHYRLLQLYCRLGLRLTKVHRAIKFEQKPWLKKYIEINTSRRQVATNDFVKDFLKLSNNAVFGKLMENLWNRIKVKVAMSELAAEKLSRKPWFNRFQIIDDDFAIFAMRQTKIKLNKPIYAGFTVLELSKLLMYEMHYDVVTPLFPNSESYPNPRIQLLFTDTDSLCYEIFTSDIYDDLKTVSDMLDTSDYSPNSADATVAALFSACNKKVPGKLKDELAGSFLYKFVGLKPKMYALAYVSEAISDLKSKLKAKGVAKTTIKKSLSFDAYEKLLLDACQLSLDSDGTENDNEPETNNRPPYLYLNSTHIRSHEHVLHTQEINKLSLSVFDDKRFICNTNTQIQQRGVHTLAYGHFSLRSE